MGEHSAIEWTDATWNPVTGCTKVSPACANCYIERQTPMRVAGRKFVKGDIPIELHRSRLAAPLKWREPRTVFVNSMSDLFHEDVPATFIAEVMAVCERTPRHTYQILTKRPERMLELFRDPPPDVRWPLPNVWLGVSVENQHFADERIPLLLQTPAAVRFLSCEPLLEFTDIRRGLHLTWTYSAGRSDHVPPPDIHGGWWSDLGTMPHDPPKLDWVIAGGESGPRVRPSDPDWFRSLRDQCQTAGVPFFFKQWGGRTPKSGGRLLDGREWSEMPARPEDPR